MTTKQELIEMIKAKENDLRVIYVLHYTYGRWKEYKTWQLGKLAKKAAKLSSKSIPYKITMEVFDHNVNKAGCCIVNKGFSVSPEAESTWQLIEDDYEEEPKLEVNLSCVFNAMKQNNILE